MTGKSIFPLFNVNVPMPQGTAVPPSTISKVRRLPMLPPLAPRGPFCWTPWAAVARSHSNTTKEKQSLTRQQQQIMDRALSRSAKTLP